MKSNKKSGTKVTLAKDIMYKVINIKGKEFKQDYDNHKIFYIHLK